MEVSLQTPKEKSPIWDYFVISEDEKFAKCLSCELKISRGGNNTRTYGTTNLVLHLKAKHLELHAEFEQKAKN